MPSRYYSNAALPTQLSAACTAAATTISVAAITGFPTKYPYTLTLDKNNGALAEAVQVTGAATGTGPYTLPVVRGIDDTTAQAHGAGALVSHDHTKQDYEEWQVTDPRRFARGFLFSSG